MRDSGHYNRVIQFFEVPTERQEEGTNEAQEPVLLKSVWALVKPRSSQNSFVNSQFIQDGTVQFETRFNPEFMPDKSMLLKFALAYYVITEVLDIDDRHEVLRITAVTRD